MAVNNNLLAEAYRQQKVNFLDNLQPDDFRNAGSFNQAEEIIDHLNQTMQRNASSKEQHKEFIKKAATNLFRENSPMVEKLVNLSQFYFEMIDSKK
jgi:hypothetical protein